MTFGIEAKTDDFMERIVIGHDRRAFEPLNGKSMLTSGKTDDGPERRAFLTRQ
tara:strand:+ start:7556 stop:7714 length:159 start_codon:yes stop_codon:yes gene_type:complete